MIFPAVPALVILMLAYMFWLAVFRMRRERIAFARAEIRRRLAARRARREKRRLAQLHR
ncbi:hypothetical protein IC614_11290 [Allosphingosinicella flava]|uniref:Heme exporter protein D n=1 Tax=Allosphingosinicella flava TaxID=2771430 RepID=A0A7T2GJ83_9SPHN|nr:hypothetical protein [Sphingosinicella flava]QPQ54886.1 hypothetical protein IC614_11290 [Sphingosinicella flava]